MESFEEPDELDGYPEKNLPKKHPEFLRARDVSTLNFELYNWVVDSINKKILLFKTIVKLKFLVIFEPV